MLRVDNRDRTATFNFEHLVGSNKNRGVFIDADGTREKFGVSPESIPDYLGLVGDTADGIPGLPGWGAKSSGAVLSEYGHIEHIPESEENWAVKVRSAARLAETLRDRMDDALLYRDLATLRDDADIPETLEELAWRGVNRDAFESLCDELGLTGLRARPTRYANE